METTMKITLEFVEDFFRATAHITMDKEMPIKTFSFILNNSLVISEMICNGKGISFEKVAEEKPSFRSLSQRIVVKADEAIESIAITYSGSVNFCFETLNNWHNILTDDIKSLNWYSVWYPQEIPIEINHDIVVVANGDQYFVVKGVYDEIHNVWVYGDEGYDPYNIMAYNKTALKTISNPYMNIYFVDDSIEEHAKKATEVYLEIIEFYNGNLFEKISIPVLDIACASPAIPGGGGFRRQDFMWCATLGSNDLETAWLYAHETAHIWCGGADYDTWEDWLNETTAEWATLLFALSKNDTALFNLILNPKLERYDSLPAIRTPDGSRPDGVHDKGTVLFYEMYKAFGVETVRKVVRTFTDLKHKSTEYLLKRLRDENLNDAADFIQDGIDR